MTSLWDAFFVQSRGQRFSVSGFCSPYIKSHTNEYFVKTSQIQSVISSVQPEYTIRLGTFCHCQTKGQSIRPEGIKMEEGVYSCG
jgi:hypothetical protein